MSRVVVYFDSVETNAGRADVTEWDFSRGNERVIRIELDSLFVFEFTLPEDYLVRTFIRADLELIYSEIPEEELEDNPCPYCRLYLDTYDCDFIRRTLFENECVGVV